MRIKNIFFNIILVFVLLLMIMVTYLIFIKYLNSDDVSIFDLLSFIISLLACIISVCLSITSNINSTKNNLISLYDNYLAYKQNELDSFIGNINNKIINFERNNIEENEIYIKLKDLPLFQKLFNGYFDVLFKIVTDFKYRTKDNDDKLFIIEKNLNILKVDLYTQICEIRKEILSMKFDINSTEKIEAKLGNIEY